MKAKTFFLPVLLFAWLGGVLVWRMLRGRSGRVTPADAQDIVRRMGF